MNSIEETTYFSNIHFIFIPMFQHFFQTLTAEIGNVLELKDVDKGIDDYKSTPHLTFDQYRYYLSKEVRKPLHFLFISLSNLANRLYIRMPSKILDYYHNI
jgi:hypothetical protein